MGAPDFFGGRTVEYFRSKIGTRVGIHPGTDQWMMGDRYGEIKKVGRKLVHVKLDRSGRTVGFHPEHIGTLD